VECGQRRRSAHSPGAWGARIFGRIFVDGKRFVTGSFDGTASIWDVVNGNLLHKR